MTDITLHLLGGFEVRAEGDTVELPRAGRRLVALLALRRQAQRRAVVAAALWPHAERVRAQRQLAALLGGLPDSVAAHVEVDTDGSVALSRGCVLDLDEALDAARRLHRDPRPVGPDLIVFRFDLLPGWFEPWLTDLQERYHLLRISVLRRLGRHQLEVGSVDDALDIARELVDDDPRREDAQLLLVDALVARGDLALARHHVEVFRRRTRAELGVEPAARWRDVAARIEHPATLGSASARGPGATLRG